MRRNMTLANIRKSRKSERLFLTPLSLDELYRLTDGTGDFLMASVLTETIRLAILHKIKTMELLPSDTHPWLTYWLIRRQGVRQGIGVIGSKNLPDENGYAELGYAVAEEYRRQGYFTEAMTEFLDWMYECPFCNGALLYIRATNIPSMRAAEKCGFLYEEMYGIYKVYRYIF